MILLKHTKTSYYSSSHLRVWAKSYPFLFSSLGFTKLSHSSSRSILRTLWLTPLWAVFYLIPVFCPLLSPPKRLYAHRTNFFWKFRLFNIFSHHTPHYIGSSPWIPFLLFFNLPLRLPCFFTIPFDSSLWDSCLRTTEKRSLAYARATFSSIIGSG